LQTLNELFNLEFDSHPKFGGLDNTKLMCWNNLHSQPTKDAAIVFALWTWNVDLPLLTASLLL
jgi:hypothetical protein